MGYELLVSNPATSGSHSWKCLLASNTNDRAMTRLAYCGRREKFSTDVELANVFWKLWGSKKEYLDLPEGWSTPEIDQRFDMVCKAMQAGFDPFDYDEEEGEDEEESFEAQSETFASECECGEGVEGEEYECTCCDGIFCVDCIENGDISAYTIMTGDNPVADHPRVEETETGSNFSGWGAICGECMSAIEYELEELPPIHEVMEEEQGTANFSMEGQVKKKGNLTELFFAGAIVGLLTFSAMKRN